MRPTNEMKRALFEAPTRAALRWATRSLDTAVHGLQNARRITGFLRGRMELQTRPTDVFISSYPRSGTTLTQWIVYLLSREIDSDPEHLTRVSPWFERSLATGELTGEDLNRFPSPRVFKSHLPREWLPDGARYVYVERDVGDVFVSYYHFYRSYLGFEGSLDDFYLRFMSGRVQYGSWFDHVAGWRAHANDPDVLILRYEDLLRNRKAAIRALLDFLGWERDERWIDRVVIESGFDAMKRREPLFDHATALLLERGMKPRSFLREGTSGAGEEALDARKQRELRERRSMGRRLAIRDLAAFLQ